MIAVLLMYCILEMNGVYINNKQYTNLYQVYPKFCEHITCKYIGKEVSNIIIIFLLTILAFDNQTMDLIELSTNMQTITVGDALIITCVTSSSAVLAWSSIEYIGNTRLEFSYLNATGSILNSTKEFGTFANLTHVNTSNSDVILESQLHTMVSADYSHFNVTCHNTGNDELESLMLLVGKSAMNSEALLSIMQNPLHSTCLQAIQPMYIQNLKCKDKYPDIHVA